MKLVIATHNKDKLKELFNAFKVDDLDVDLLSLDDFPDISEIEETGSTLTENALIKAREVHSITKLPTISDDTGLEVDALHGKPGVYTARYAGENCSYYDNINKLLHDLEKVPMPNRTAKFKTIIAFVDKDCEFTAEGIAEGIILRTMIGDNGFGYDPVFFIPNEKKTFAEMTIDEKELHSHRGKAIKQMIATLIPHINNSIHKEIA